MIIIIIILQIMNQRLVCLVSIIFLYVGHVVCDFYNIHALKKLKSFPFEIAVLSFTKAKIFLFDQLKLKNNFGMKCNAC